MLAKLPAIVATYRELIEKGAKALTDPRAVSAAREAIRKLLPDGTIVLSPNAAHTSLVGAVRFVDLGDHILGLAGVKRRVKHLAPTSQATVVAPIRERVSSGQ